jgi:HAD superfamily hydrolase (TIGR01509 family)
MPLRAVLFDFDGVLADTENVHVAAWERTFGLLGWDIPPETCSRAAEEDDRIFVAEVFAGRGIGDGNIEGWVRRKQAIVLAMLADWPPVYPGVAQLVHELRGRAKLAVVTGTWRENVESVLRAAGLIEAFSDIIAKEDVAAPKPDPEAYRLALKRLAVEPADAVALEDSPSGVLSARAAGIPVIAVGHRLPPGDWVCNEVYVADITCAAEMLTR